MLQKGEPMDDLISRQAAIDALDECYCGGEDSCGEPWIYKENAVEAIQMIEPMPPAQPKRGKWILDRSGAYCCSECMEPCATYFMMKPRDKYCKMCGSRNEVTT